jgi:hypothetical protein
MISRTTIERDRTSDLWPADARDALRAALLKFPSVLPPLIQKVRDDIGSRVQQNW